VFGGAKWATGRFCSHAAKPAGAVALRVQTIAVLIQAPEGFDGKALGGARIASDADDPAVDLALVLAKERFKGFRLARRESLENVHLASLLILRGRLRRGYIPEWAVPRVSARLLLGMPTRPIRVAAPGPVGFWNSIWHGGERSAGVRQLLFRW